MRSSRARYAVVMSGMTVLALVMSAQAASAAKPKTLVITDPAGDAKPGVHGDLVKLTLTTTGAIVKKAYTPKNFVISLETADAIDTSGTTVYELDADLDGCEAGFLIYTTPGVDGSDGGACVHDDSSATNIIEDKITAAPIINGKTITWSIPFTTSPKAFKKGSAMSGMHAYTAFVEPVLGLFGPYLLNDSALPVTFDNDDINPADTYKIG